MRMILAALVLFALVLAPYEVVLVPAGAANGVPWKTFSESAKNGVGRPVLGSCPSAGSFNEVLFTLLEKDGVTYLFAAGDNGRFIFYELDKAGDKAVRVYTGKQLDSPRHDEIHVTDSHAYNKANDEVCKVLFPPDA